MNEYNIIYNLTLSFEKGYANHPADRGGATLDGVTQGTYNAYRKSKNLNTQDVRLMTDPEKAEIYYKRYYVPSKANLMSFPLAAVHFDTAVNFGVTGSIKMLQFLLKVNPDGKFGPITYNAVNHFDSLEFAIKYCDLRIERRYSIVKRNPSQKVFLKGWLNRDNKLKNFIKNNKY